MASHFAPAWLRSSSARPRRRLAGFTRRLQALLRAAFTLTLTLTREETKIGPKYVESPAFFRTRSGIEPIINRPVSDINFQRNQFMTVPKRIRAIKDRRSTWARRHKVLADAFAVELGANLGVGLSTADKALADHAATVAIEAERMKAAQLNGESLDLEDLVRVTNVLIRARKELGTRVKPSPGSTMDWDAMQEEADRLEQEQRDADQ
jgi:hypothetical protein